MSVRKILFRCDKWKFLIINNVGLDSSWINLLMWELWAGSWDPTIRNRIWTAHVLVMIRHDNVDLRLHRPYYNIIIQVSHLLFLKIITWWNRAISNIILPQFLCFLLIQIECTNPCLGRYVAIGLYTVVHLAYLVLQEVEVYALPGECEWATGNEMAGN